MKPRPAYFEATRLRASQRWDQREQDPENAALWHLVFMSVQSPRHVLSELLQNADDAGATEAAVRIENQTFFFTHNGEDFTEDHFASLCRFGYSNKRSLHTIGFRGIGFKSTFSLGETVELYSPTLSVAFHKQRFTEPIWLDSSDNGRLLTEIRVAISDTHRIREIEDNLQEWLKSPLSLIFFNHIRQVSIGDSKLSWEASGPGPVSGSEWIALHGATNQRFLLAQSELEEFPPEALLEIKQEHMLGADNATGFPPSRVEIVMGAKGRLYVVLPTGVATVLPFACNAPFIQDPARSRIKDPEISPTNRWLLKRAGALAASVMLRWLEQSSVSLPERSGAYSLFPDADPADHSQEGTCATIVQNAFDAAIKGKAFLLTNSSELKLAGQSVIVPQEIFDVWPAESISTFLDSANRPSLSRYISAVASQNLLHRGFVENISKDAVVAALKAKHLPRPKSWGNLLLLWAYIAPEIIGYRYQTDTGNAIRILPVQGKEELYGASEIVRLGEKRLLQKEADWDFLAGHLLVLNQNWPRFLAEQRRQAEDNKDKKLQRDVDTAYNILKVAGLEDASDVSRVTERVAAEFFAKKPIALADCVQLAQIAAKLGATIGASFRFATRNLHLFPIGHSLLYDKDGTLEELLPDAWCSTHLLHSKYSGPFESCSADEWLGWISSGRAGLPMFAHLTQTVSSVYGRSRIEDTVKRRGYSSNLFYPYVTEDFRIEDWDFEDILWRHWTELAVNDANLWARIINRILDQPSITWTAGKSAKVHQVATTGNMRIIISEDLLPSWLVKLRELPCLPDTRGFIHKPTELLRRTPETESLIDVEPFVHGRLDTEATRPLLKLLGVRATPTGPEHLLDRLRALARTDTPPIREVEKWYRRLDQMVETCSTSELAIIRRALREEKLVFTDGTGWTNGADVFLSADEDDVPGAAMIRPSLNDLMLWKKIGIPERPTADLAIQWLKTLPSGQTLAQDDLRRVRALLTRHPLRIWTECGRWLNLAAEWVPTTRLSYALTLQMLVPWSHLHEWVKQKTADFQRLTLEITQAWPFTDLPALGTRIEERFNRSPNSLHRPERQPWLNQVGIELCRIEIEGNDETVRIRDLAAELAATLWQTAPELETVPYIDGTPAGTPRRAEVVWLNRVLYVNDLPKAKLASLVPVVLGKTFSRPEVLAALNYCFGRTAADVTEYLEENFKLAPREVATPRANQEPTSPADSAPTGPGVPSLASVSEPATSSSPNTASGTGDGPGFGQFDGSSEFEEGASNNPDESEDTADTVQENRPRLKPKKPKLIERFALSQGYHMAEDGYFVHADGSWIAKAVGDRFPWEKRSSAGIVVNYYWPKDICLEREPLELEADVWGLIDKFPETYSLVLSNLQGDPIEVLGVELRAMKQGGALRLYPATYRLVYSDESGSK